MIVGRQKEVASLGALIERARTGLTALLVEGEPGIGKTSLLREGIRLAEAAGFFVLSCGGSAAESTLEFAALEDLVRPIPSRHWDALPSPQRRALETALHLAEPDGPVLDRRAIGSGVRGLMAGLAAEQPLLLAHDDLHWVDVPTAAIDEFVVRRLPGLREGILTTERTTERSRIAIEAPFASVNPTVRSKNTPRNPSNAGTPAAIRAYLAARCAVLIASAGVSMCFVRSEMAKATRSKSIGLVYTR